MVAFSILDSLVTRVSMEVIVTSDRKLGEISPTHPGRIQPTFIGVK